MSSDRHEELITALSVDESSFFGRLRSRSRILRTRSFSQVLGCERYTFRRMFLLTMCVLGVVQYGMVLVWGDLEDDLVSYYGLTSKQGTSLYGFLSLGSCALSFLPGLLYDFCGPTVAMISGTLSGIFPLVLQLGWTKDFPAFLSTFDGLAFCYVLFGLSSSFFNVIGCIAPVVAFDAKNVGKASALVQVCLSLGVTIQSAVYSLIKSSYDDFIEAYLIYALVFIIVCGVLTSFTLWICKPIFVPAQTESPENDEDYPKDGFAIESGSVLICTAPIAKVYASISDEVLETKEAGCLVIASGRAEKRQGVWMVPIQPTGAIGLECLQLSSPVSEQTAQPQQRSIARQICSPEFLYMSLVFLIGIGFSFSFLEVENKMAKEVGASNLLVIFGVMNAIGRVLVSIPLDYTKKHPLGGIHTYIVASLIIFVIGLLVLVLPPSPGVAAMQIANALIALGYGGMLGSVPLALRAFFGTQNLGIIYGILYFWVYGAIYFWEIFSAKPDGCSGIACYRAYNLGGSLSISAVIAFGIVFLVRHARQEYAQITSA